MYLYIFEKFDSPDHGGSKRGTPRGPEPDKSPPQRETPYFCAAEAQNQGWSENCPAGCHGKPIGSIHWKPSPPNWKGQAPAPLAPRVAEGEK